MDRFRLAILCVALSGSAAAQGPDPLGEARFAPPDVTLFVHVRQAAELRSRIADRPIRAWVESMVEGALASSWERLARELKLEPGEVFDRYLGRRVTLVVRSTGSGSEWAMWSDADASDVQRLQARLRPRLLGPRRGVPVAEAADHGVLLASTAEHLLIGPRGAAALFHEVLDRMAGPAGAPSLATAPGGAAALAGDLRPSQALLLAGHAPPLGGWSAVAIDLDGRGARLQLSSRFDHSPFERRVTTTVWDASPLELLEDRTLLAIMEPTDAGDGLPERYLGAMLQQPLLSPELGRRLKSRRIITVGEAEGRRLERPVDLMSTTAALCLEVDDAERSRGPLDALMVSAARRIAELGHGSFLLEINVPPVAANAPRQVDVSAATGWLTGGFPIMRNIQLSWQVTEGPHGAWCVIASHPHHLSEVVGALAVAPAAAAGPPQAARLDSVGTANGVRIGQHLRSWSETGALFRRGGGAAAVTPEEEKHIRSAMDAICAFAAGVERGRWRLWRPDASRVRAEVELILAPPDSAGEGR